MSSGDAPRERARLVVLALALVLGVAFVYAPVRAHAFVAYDDDVYLTANPHVARGLDWAEIRWVWTNPLAANYHPLTWMSHMLDVQLFGLEPGPHHLVNVALHALNTLLVLALGRRLLASTLGAALAAGLFALHPLRVESVAWASERKDLLCAAFFLAGVLAYLAYGRARSLGRYLVVCVSLALALLSKPMAVTFPLVALLLDVWPLGRLDPVRPWRATEPGGGRRLVLEKLPLVALALLGAVATWLAQESGGSTSSARVLPLDLRVLNALAACGVYLRQSVWPTGLAVFYPLAAAVEEAPRARLLVPALLAGLVLGAGCLWAWRARAQRPWFAFAWGWFLLTLVPVLGLKQVGAQAHADRYTYLPLLGLAWIAAGFAQELVRRRASLRGPALALAAAVLLALGLGARAQVGVWADTRTLFEHALRVTERNYMAHTVLGTHHLQLGETAEARAHLEQALAIYPLEASTLGLLGRLELEAENLPAAEAFLQRAARLRALPWVHHHLGRLRLAQHDRERAVAEFSAALELDPWLTEARFNLGQVLFELGRMRAARAELERAFALEPGAQRPRAHNNLGLALLSLGEPEPALAHFEAAAAAQPGFFEAELNAGLGHLQRGALAPARAALERAVLARPENAEARLVLAQVLARTGESARAAAELAAALEQRPALRDDPRARELSRSLGPPSGD